MKNPSLLYQLFWIAARRICQTVLISKVTGPNSVSAPTPPGAWMNALSVSLHSGQELLNSHSGVITASVVFESPVTGAPAPFTLSFPEENGCLIVSGGGKKKNTRLPPHSFLGSVFVTESGRIHTEYWNSWNVHSRPVNVFFFSSSYCETPAAHNNSYCVYYRNGTGKFSAFHSTRQTGDA